MHAAQIGVVFSCEIPGTLTPAGMPPTRLYRLQHECHVHPEKGMETVGAKETLERILQAAIVGERGTKKGVDKLASLVSKRFSSLIWGQTSAAKPNQSQELREGGLEVSVSLLTELELELGLSYHGPLEVRGRLSMVPSTSLFCLWCCCRLWTLTSL